MSKNFVNRILDHGAILVYRLYPRKMKGVNINSRILTPSFESKRTSKITEA